MVRCQPVRRIGSWGSVVLLGMLWAVALAARADAAGSLPELEEKAIRAAVERVAPAVVRIETVGGLERVGEMLVGTGPTTGLIVSADGWIVSSAFNFVQKPDSILVTLADGARLPAKLVATDHSRMLVLLRVESPRPLPTAEAVPSAEMRPGQWAIAVGRTYAADEPNVSVGIVSALERVWGRAIQTDAKISPANYGGPLVDIAGRVLGVLAPLAPDAASEVAGVDWYDSGIGFAIPLDHVERMLPAWSKGKDLYAGILGINLKGTDPYSQPAKLVGCRFNSPAAEAGLKAGDEVVEINGHPVTRQAQLKQELSRHYAGDKVKLIVLRNDQRIEREIELIDKLEPYDYPFVGILPLRPYEGKPEGLVVRYVYPKSPAEKAGVRIGDTVVSVAAKPVKDWASAADALRTLAVNQIVAIGLRRDSQEIPVELTLGRLPEDVPGALPAPHVPLGPLGDAARPATGDFALRIPEFKNECLAYVPSDYHPALGYGLIVWLHAPGGYKQEEFLARWKARCDREDLILLAPCSADSTKWEPGEARFVWQAIEEILKSYHVDRTRIVVGGDEAGGALAYVVGLSHAESVTGVAVVGSPVPRFLAAPENDPMHRLAFFVASASKSPFAASVEARVKQFRQAKFPVTTLDLGEKNRVLTADELDELLRWSDTLDRL